MEATEEEATTIVSGKAVQAAREAMDGAIARMERTANRAVERLIRRGYVERSDVEALRAGGAECRRLQNALRQAEGAR